MKSRISDLKSKIENRKSKILNMRWSVYLLAVMVASCTTFSREKEQQSKIDSLTNELKKRDTVTKKQIDTTKEVKRDTVVIEESDDAANESDVKEIVAKKKEQKTNSLLDEKNHESKGNDSLKEQPASSEGENYEAVDERNAVLKRVTADAPTFKPQFLGGFKDIKFNFFNNYPYRLEQVILKVHYIREDGSEIKAEAKILKDVAANSRLALTAPDHNTTGKKLKVTVEAVQCREISLCFYSSEPAKSMDPYRCR